MVRTFVRKKASPSPIALGYDILMTLSLMQCTPGSMHCRGPEIHVCGIQSNISLRVFSYISIYTCCSTSDLDAFTGISSEALPRVHGHTFSHLDGRNGCRTLERFVGGQGHLQGGPVLL